MSRRPVAVASRFLLLFVALLFVAACRPHAVMKPPIAVRIEPVTMTNRAATTRYSGTALAVTQVELAFRLGGYIDSIAMVPGSDGKKLRPLQAGDRVTHDMVVGSLRKKDFTQRYAEFASMNAEASAGYTKAKADYGRAKKLFDKGVITQAELDGARSRYDGFAGSVGSASARAGQANLAVSDSELRSPLDGIVLERRIEVGGFSAPGVPAFVLADTSKMKIVFGVPDSVQQALVQGQSVSVTTDAVPDRAYAGIITKIAAEADPKTRIFDVEATLDNGDGALKVGMVATVEIGRAQVEPRMLLPLSAVVREPGTERGFAVFVLDHNKVAHVRTVTLGKLVGNRVSVVDGLTPGDVIVTQGSTLLIDGDAVNVVPGDTIGDDPAARPLAEGALPAGATTPPAPASAAPAASPR